VIDELFVLKRYKSVKLHNCPRILIYLTMKFVTFVFLRVNYYFYINKIVILEISN